MAIIPHSKHVPGGVAVRGETFGQCIDAIRALRVDWAPGTVAGRSDATVLADLAKAELPDDAAGAPARARRSRRSSRSTSGRATRSRPNSAVADVRADRAEIWSSLKTPIWAQEQLARIWACR